MKATKVALFVLAVGFFASCGGEKKAETPAVDSTAAPVEAAAPAVDSSAMATDSSAAAPAVDSAAAAPAAH
jgi:hypothetical protein